MKQLSHIMLALVLLALCYGNDCMAVESTDFDVNGDLTLLGPDCQATWGGPVLVSDSWVTWDSGTLTLTWLDEGWDNCRVAIDVENRYQHAASVDIRITFVKGLDFDVVQFPSTTVNEKTRVTIDLTEAYEPEFEDLSGGSIKLHIKSTNEDVFVHVPSTCGGGPSFIRVPYVRYER